ncbi:MAG TPA: ATP-binding protein [Phycisphaerae bacterium]|nr:ATP-binding protein [Phycisphaerae bacterium]HNU45462.1 ATP-binding protein [Phycisphaerae bacterium]
MGGVDPKDESTFPSWVVPSDPKETVRPKEVILQEMEARGFSKDEAFAVKLALEEAFSNAIKHGNRCDSAKSILIRYAVSAERVVVIVRDEGGGFEPEQIPDPTHPDRLPLPNGRGIMLMRAYMDEVCYRDHGREVYMVKRRTPGGTPPCQSPTHR